MDFRNRRSLAAQALSALKWNYGGTLVRSGTQILIGIVLARILGPEPFGLVAIAWLVIGLGNLVADFGFGAALVQRETISEEEICYTFTMQVLIGIGLTLLIISSADLIAQFFKQQEAALVLRAFSLVFVLQAFGQTATNLLKRNLDFRNIQSAQILSYVISFVLLGIPFAYLGFGVWSLVIAQLSQSSLYSLLTYFRVKHSIKPLFTSRAVGFFGFGTKVIATNLVNWIISNMDNVFVGRFFGVVSLGLYSRVYVLMTTPMNNVVSVLQGILFPTYSKTQNDTLLLKRVYLASTSVIALVILPVFGSVAAVPHTVVEGLYGSHWSGAIPLLVPLALAMPFHAVMALAGPLIWGRGKVELELRVQAITAALFIVVLLVTSKVSVVALTWGVFGMYVVRFFLMTREVLQVVRASWNEMLATLQGGFLLLIGTVSIASGTDAILQFYETPSLIRLLVDVTAAAATAVVLLLAFPRVIISTELVWMLSRILNKLPQSPWLLFCVNKLKLTNYKDDS